MSISIVLKRLEILKATVSLQDADDIAYQTDKLKATDLTGIDVDISAEIGSIIRLIEQGALGDALKELNVLLQRHNALLRWIDPEIEDLQAEIRMLSVQLTNHESELSDLERTIHEFEYRHTDLLGSVILRLLELRRKIAAQKVQDEPDNPDNQQRYKETEKDEQQYKGAYEQSRKTPVHQLTDEEGQELKNLFRKISKMTHPDCVEEQYKQQAAELFMKAKEAKNNNDLNALRAIYDHLTKATPFAMKEGINEKELLKQEAANIRNKIEQLKQQIQDIKKSETYTTISGIDNWDTYLNETREKLEAEIERLHNQYNEQYRNTTA